MARRQKISFARAVRHLIEARVRRIDAIASSLYAFGKGGPDHRDLAPLEIMQGHSRPTGTFTSAGSMPERPVTERPVG